MPFHYSSKLLVFCFLPCQSRLLIIEQTSDNHNTLIHYSTVRSVVPGYTGMKHDAIPKTVLNITVTDLVHDVADIIIRFLLLQLLQSIVLHKKFSTGMIWQQIALIAIPYFFTSEKLLPHYMTQCMQALHTEQWCGELPTSGLGAPQCFSAPHQLSIIIGGGRLTSTIHIGCSICRSINTWGKYVGVTFNTK